ncbi:MAG TPA: isochorismate synthase [Candidatus Binataceae bacterium]
METDLSGPALDGRMDGLLRRASDQSRRENRAVLVSLTQPIQPCDPLALYRAAAGTCADRLLWSQPDTGFSLTGFGAAYVIETAGSRRFSDTAAAWNALCSGALVEPDNGPCGPVLMGGFAFDPGQPASKVWRGYPDGRMVLPRVCLTTSAGRFWLTMNAVLGLESSAEREAAEIFRMRRLLQMEPAAITGRPWCARPTLSELRSASGWRNEVAAAARAVRRGELGKVVLARAVKLQASQPFDPAIALRRLAAGYPTCVVFAVANGDGCFLGATPERLLKVCQGEVSTTCLAGSYPRGAIGEDDLDLASALLADPKERREHALVLSAMLETLSSWCAQLDVPETPSVLKLPNVQHLCTPISGRLAPDRSVLHIVEQLHPTPSVGGQPRDLALRFIREREALDRGWYAGTVGWVDYRGEGEFAVAIRAALLRGAEATLFAGCGIVADSDPDREYAESCIKLTPMLTALGAQ